QERPCDRFVHRPQDEQRRWRRTYLPAGVTVHREDRGEQGGCGSPRQAVLSAQPHRQSRPHPREAANRRPGRSNATIIFTDTNASRSALERLFLWGFREFPTQKALPVFKK